MYCVVRWLPSSPQQALGIDFQLTESEGENSSRSELGRGFIVSGRTWPCGTSSMCNMSLAVVVPYERVRSFHRALVSANSDVLLRVESFGKAEVRRMGVEGLCQSGQHFLDVPLDSWLFRVPNSWW